MQDYLSDGLFFPLNTSHSKVLIFLDLGHNLCVQFSPKNL